MSLKQTLRGPWRLAVDPGNVGREERWFDRVPPDAKDAPVPGIIQQVVPGYHGVAWYWHAFRPQQLARDDERALLRFGAVDYLADVWLDGVQVGTHEGPEFAFAMDVTDRLRDGREHLLAVRVLNPTDQPIDGFVLKETARSFKNGGDPSPGSTMNYGGIMRAVELTIVPAVRIEDLFVRPDPATGKMRVQITVQNDPSVPAKVRLRLTVDAIPDGRVRDQRDIVVACASGESVHELDLTVHEPHLWSTTDPYLYRVAVRLEAPGRGDAVLVDERSVRCGFRDFRVIHGYFHLNGRRIFVRSSHTVNDFPVGQHITDDPDLLRRDITYAKAAGFNMIRFISGTAHPEQLDLCDEIGMMVYEESFAGLQLAASEHLSRRFETQVFGMVRRDRNHPCITMWGLLNEVPDSPAFREAVAILPGLRALDDSRLVLLNSGRTDKCSGIGSLSNPGSARWEHEWGAESAEAADLRTFDGKHDPACDEICGGPFGWYPQEGWETGIHQLECMERCGDFHIYPFVPQTREHDEMLRRIGAKTKPIFLSEYGIGSLMDVVQGARLYEQNAVRPDLDDAKLFSSQEEKLLADWKRFGMEKVYPFPHDLLIESARLHVRMRRVGFDLIRSNPKLCGYSLTGLMDHGWTGEGLWTIWRKLKPGILDGLADGWSPLRWCLFVQPLHGYADQPFEIEAVLANEDVLRPGDYPATFRIFGPDGIAWEKKTRVRIPLPEEGQLGPLAVPVFKTKIKLDGPSGEYVFAAQMDRGGAPAGGRLTFHVAHRSSLPRVEGMVTTWGIGQRTEKWLGARGLRCRDVDEPASRNCELILVGTPDESSKTLSAWRELARRMARGATVVFLSPSVFQRGDDAVGWLPLVKKGRCYKFFDWLYHKECVAKPHPIFEGLPGRGIMEWDYYGPVIPLTIFDGQETPDEVMAAAFATGYPCAGGYASGVLVGAYAFGAGRFLLNTLKILENLTVHPAADRLLLNLIRFAQRGLAPRPVVKLPAHFESQLAAIGWRP